MAHGECGFACVAVRPSFYTRAEPRVAPDARISRATVNAITLGVIGHMKIRVFQPNDQAAVVALWQECGLTRPWNDPRADIARKLTEQPELFLVGTVGAELVATAMVGFDGHRGWVYYLAVSHSHRKQSYGRALMQEAERLLMERGCPKLNLLVRSSNAEVIEFYGKLGYVQDDVVSLGKRLIHDRTSNRATERPASGKPVPAGKFKP